MFLRRKENLTFRSIAQECGISKSAAFRVCKFSTLQRNTSRVQGGVMKRNPGRPRKVDERSVGVLILNLKNSRKINANVTVNSIVRNSGLSVFASRRTFSWVLNEEGYKFCQARKKGLATEKDRRLRRKYARNMKHHGVSFWTEELSFWMASPLYASTIPRRLLVRPNQEFGERRMRD